MVSLARDHEETGSLFLAIGSLCLFVVFPFDYSHLADVLPSPIRFVLSWVTNDIAKAVFILQIIVGLVMAPVSTWKYLSVRGRKTS